MATLGSLVVRVGADIASFTTDMNRAAMITSKNSKKMAADINRFAKIGGAAMVGVMTIAVNEARKFEKAMDEVSTLLDDTSSIDGMKKSMGELAVQFGSSQVEQAEALYQAISAGAAEGEEAIALLTAANKLAIGGVTDVKTSVDGLTTVMNAYGDKAGDAAHVSDVFFMAVKAGKTTIPELAGSIGNVATIAGQMGVSFEETAAAVATLTKSGMATNVAMTGLKAAFSNVAKPAEKAVKLSQELGLEFNSTALKSKGLAVFLDDVKKATGGNVDQMSELFGSVEALGAVMGLTGDAAEDFNGLLDEMLTNVGDSDVAFAKMADSAEFRFKQMRAAGEASLIALGEQILVGVVPTMDLLVETFTDVGDGANFAAEAGKFVIDVFNILMSAGIIVKNLFEALGIVIGNFAGIIISVFGGLKDTIGAFVSGVGTAFTALKDGEFKQAGEAIASIGGDIGESFTNAARDITSAMSTIATGVTGELTDGIESLNRVWGENVDTMEDDVKPALESTAVAAREVVAATQETSKATATLGSTFQDMMGTAIETFDALPKEAEKSAKGMEAPLTGVAAVIENTFKRLDDTFASFWQTLFKEGKFSLKGIKDLLLDTLAQMAHAALTQPIVMRIGTMMTGGLASGTASASGGGSLFGGISTLGAGIAGGALGMGGSGALFGSSSQQMIGSAIGSTALGIGGAVIGGILGGPLGAKIGAMVGAFVGGIIGGFVGSLFSSDPKIKAGGIDGLRGTNDTTFFDSMLGGVFVGKTKGGLDESVQEFGEALAAFDNAIAEFLTDEQIGRASEALKAWSLKLENDAISVEAMLEGRFAVILGTMGQNVQDYVNQFSGLEERTDALARFVTALNTMGSTIAAFVESNPMDILNEQLDNAATSSTEKLYAIGDALVNAVSSFDGTPEMMDEISRLVDARYRGEIEYLTAVHNLVQNISASIAAQQQSIREALEGPKSFGQIMQEMQVLFASLSSASSPEEIANIVGAIQGLVGQAVSGLGDGLTSDVAQWLIDFLSEVEAAATARAELLAQKVVDEGEILREAVLDFAETVGAPLELNVQATDAVNDSINRQTGVIQDGDAMNADLIRELIDAVRASGGDQRGVRGQQN